MNQHLPVKPENSCSALESLMWWREENFRPRS